ncbi:hypothetical protein FHS57_005455 [Runella defluvii]|uniref:Uncharacterized protein n=1 Tax=Runella defluvii TaxID=370973 RepID=A0A7W6ETB9_9BACT|nr:hypothetical protein [Runella defluvii]MBB3841427.1 hypothetical protein [Runella defluvii]
MKKFVSIGLILAVLLQPFYRLWIVVTFQINQDFIAATLCEERNTPENDCQGHCYLCKRLHQADEREKQIPILVKLAEAVLYVQENHTEWLPSPIWHWLFPIPLQTLFLHYNFLGVYDFLDPPEATVC